MRLLETSTGIIARYWQELRRYADFTGLSDWQAYGSFLTVNLFLTLFFKVMENIRGDGFFEIVGLMYGFVVLLPGVAVTVRVLRYAFRAETSEELSFRSGEREDASNDRL